MRSCRAECAAGETLVRGALPQIERAFESDGFVELGLDRLTVRA
jgi:hypothetical protein